MPSKNPLINVVRGRPRLAPNAGPIVRVRGVDAEGKKYAIKGCNPRVVQKDGVWLLQLDPVPDSRLPFLAEVPVDGISDAISSSLG